MRSRAGDRPSLTTLRRLERSSGALATQAVARMDEELPWFRTMPADQRSWVTLVAQAGLASLVEWCRNPGRPPRLTGEVFGAAPRELVRVVALKQTVDLIKITVETLEDHVATVAEPGDEEMLRLAVLRFSREVAFATAHVYASFAESRGAWDARLEALLVDALVRGERSEELAGRAAALGWSAMSPVTVVVGPTPEGVEDPHSAVRRAAVAGETRPVARVVDLPAIVPASPMTLRARSGRSGGSAQSVPRRSSTRSRARSSAHGVPPMSSSSSIEASSCRRRCRSSWEGSRASMRWGGTGSASWVIQSMRSPCAPVEPKVEMLGTSRPPRPAT